VASGMGEGSPSREEQVQEQHQEREHGDGGGEPGDDRPPGAPEALASASGTARADGVGLRAALGEHAAVAAERRPTPRAGADGEPAAADAALGAAPGITDAHQGHGPSVAGVTRHGTRGSGDCPRA